MTRDCIPPYQYLCQGCDHCPQAMSTYLTLWRSQGEHLSRTYEKKKIRQELLVSTIKFQHDLLALEREGLLEVDENPSFITVTLADDAGDDL